MAIKVQLEFTFTEDQIEELDIEQLGDLIEKMVGSTDYDTEIDHAHFDFVEMV